ncbi:phospholysine phosphohistidine inorganic pyrophosphate phosphatase [Brevipalpus obovatus]|uniref:phospholysine phosphohistidine inorganic pyrophosphate phosphatase n=1 Tax=Brevipalpus obovatus TaxID=246614 RepID=UPI003D9EBBD5
MSKSAWIKSVKGLLIDISGVLHEAGTDHAMFGAIEALTKLRQAKVPYLLCTNETSLDSRSFITKLNDLGLNVTMDDIQAPAPLTCRYLKDNNLRPFLLIRPELRADFEGLNENDPNAVVIGDAVDAFSFENLNKAFRLLIGNPQCEFIAMGRTKYYQKNGELVLDLGVYVAALECAVEREAKVIGKPAKEYFHTALRKLHLESNQVAMVGDDILSDIGGAQKAGLRGVLVRSGKYRAERDENHATVKPDLICNNLLEFVNMILT